MRPISKSSRTPIVAASCRLIAFLAVAAAPSFARGVEPEAKVQAESDTKAQTKPEAKVQAKPEAKVQAKPEAKVQAKPEAKVQAADSTEPKPALATETKTTVASPDPKAALPVAASAAAASKKSETPTARLDLNSIQPEPPLMGWRLAAGASLGCADCGGDHRDGLFGLALRVDMGPTVTEAFTPYFEVGVRAYKQATYLDLAFAPTYWLDIGIPEYWYFALTPVLGVSLADIRSGLGESNEATRYGRRFQYQAGAELGFWRALANLEERSRTERIITRMGELENDYRNQCLSASNSELPECQSLANTLGNLRTVLDSADSTKCPISSQIVTGEAGKRKIALEVLDEIEVCRFLAKERSSSGTAQTKVGGSVRLTETGGRGLPALSTFELSLGVAF